MRTLLLAIILLITLSVSGQDKMTVFTDINIIDVETGEVKKAQNLIISKGKILAIEKKLKKKYAEAENISSTGKWAIPGLIDAHVHFFQSGGLYARPDVIDLREITPYEKERARVFGQAEDFMNRYLSLGITTVCDVGGPFSNYKVRDLADSLEKSPNVFVTGPLISSYQPEEFNIDDAPIIKINTPDEARALVQKQLPHKPDFIKIWYIVLRGQTPEMHLPIIQATIEESHKHNIPVAVHATQLETARIAVQNGADILVHSVDNQLVDNEFISLLKEKATSYIPTLIVSNNYEKVLSQNLSFNQAEQDLANPFTLGSLMDLQHISPNLVPAWVKRLMTQPYQPLSKIELMHKNLKTLADAGINIVTGTDAGNIGTLHASSYMEEIASMKKSGLSNLQILQASTINGAKMLGRAELEGNIKTGKVANFVILNQNPMDEIKHIHDVARVVKDGRVYEKKHLMIDNPEAVVQRQLNAYNLGDIDAFMNTYNKDIKVYNFPDQLIYDDWDKMKAGYGQFFKNTPKLHCEILNRIVEGNTIVDQERVTGLPNGGIIRASAIYTVKEGKITEVRFLRP